MRFLRFSVLALVAVGAACASQSKFLGMEPGEVWAVGEEEFQEGDWEEAIEAFEIFVSSFPSDERMPQARLRIAEAYFNDRKYFTAQMEYTRFLERYPGHEEIPRAALMVCRSYYELSPIPQRDQTYTHDAARVCQNVVRDYAGIDDDVADEAQGYLNEMRAKLAKKAFDNGEFYARRDLLDSAIIYYEMVVEQYGDTEWAPRALARLVETYQVFGYEDDVERYRRQLANSYPDSPEGRAAAAALAEQDGAAQPDTARSDTAGVAGRGSV